MLIGDVFINDINHLARTQHHSFVHDKNLQSNLPTMKHHYMKSPNSTFRI